MVRVAPLLDPDRQLAISYVGGTAAAPVSALWALDTKFGNILATASDRQLAQFKLTWWREALEALDRQAPPAEPLLEQLARHALTAGVSGRDLAALAEGWEYLTVPEQLSREALERYAELRGGALFGLSARLLGHGGGPEVSSAGAGWALADLARRTSRPDEARIALLAAMAGLPKDFRWPRELRPIGMLAVLAARDAERGPQRVEPQGAPARMLRMLRHRLTGR